ncbi:MAG: hypothetical protein P8Y71_18630 [Pseudolabrys sp.]|jgi:pyroglutamyl-peptidase
MPAPARHLSAAASEARVPAALSRDAGHYLCNYLCWHAAQAARARDGPRLAAFVHVPLSRRHVRPRGRTGPRLGLDDLTRAGTRVLLALAAATRR